MRLARRVGALGGGHRRAPGTRPARLRPRRRRSGGGLTPVDLERFGSAQAGGVHERALSELAAGRKTGHWMWFVFPQLAGLGRSPTAARYGISGLDEARAYLADPVLGRRLRACAGALLTLPGDPTAAAVLGPVDAMKLRSSMTLFDVASAPGDGLWGRVLDRFFDGVADPLTVEMLSAG